MSDHVPVGTMWWCPTCQERIPQPRWQNPGKPNARSYHDMPGLQRDHTIVRVPLIEGTATP